MLNVVYSKRGGAQQLDLYLPGGTPPPGGFPVILALPGGGWRWVRRQDLGQAVSSFTHNGYVVAVANYAFAGSSPPSTVWPTNLEDVQDAIRWLRSKSTKFQINPNKVALWGESAGGHLAALAALDPAQTPGAAPANVQAVVDFYGPTDLPLLWSTASKTDPYLVTFLGGTPSQKPANYAAASPVNHVTPGAPPFLIFQGTADTAVPPSQSSELYAKLQAAGVPVKIEWAVGQPHGFRLIKYGPINYRTEVLSFLSAALNGHGTGG
jgi:acetyl esterase/lipase